MPKYCRVQSVLSFVFVLKGSGCKKTDYQYPVHSQIPGEISYSIRAGKGTGVEFIYTISSHYH